MAWYDVFARFYDASLERHYREQRSLACAALQAAPGDCVLDLPCGTGQSFGVLSRAVGSNGCVLGVDLSKGMLREAQRRVEREKLTNVRLLQADAATLSMSEVLASGAPRPSRLHVFLGMSVFPDHVRVLENLVGLLAPGGRCVLVDVYAETLGIQGKMVNWLARADITRRFWEPLERLGVHGERTELPSKPLHGGKIWLASATKP